MSSQPSATIPSSLYRAIWRWHFFAGLIAIPFMLLLATTGGLYLFKDEIDRTLFGYRNVVPVGAATLAPEALVAAATDAVPGQAAIYRDPPLPDASSVVTLRTDAGDVKVFVDPYTGKVLDQVAANREFSWVLKKIHSLEYFGATLNHVIEAMGGFAIVLIVSGIYLWWPRNRPNRVARGGVATIRWQPGRRALWRDLHAVTGAYVGVIMLLLAVTGMPWSGLWGGQVNAWATQLGLGYPPGAWDNVPVSDQHLQHVVEKAGWTVENSPVPESTLPMAVPSIGLNRAVAVARDLGIAPGFELALPATPEGVYSATIFPDDLGRQRILHIDQYSGKPLVDLGFDQYGPVAQAIEWGINVHQGQEWGLFNQLLMAGTCLTIIVMSFAAIIMWWKRRPRGRVGVPPFPADRRVYTGLWLAALAVGVLFPVTGIGILLMLAVDWLVIRTIAPLRRAFS
ncbi:MAG TPA: PepSY domain-containing protein [Dongiaceae bacterium]|nr:PepSY domain-containing protein [Dongiaceae bacterium]